MKGRGTRMRPASDVTLWMIGFPLFFFFRDEKEMMPASHPNTLFPECWSQWPHTCLWVYVRNRFTCPKPRDGLRDTKHSERDTLTDSPTRSGVWWAGTPGTVTASTFIPWQAGPSPVPHWLSTMGLQSSRTSPSLTAYSFFSLPILSPYFSKEL